MLERKISGLLLSKQSYCINPIQYLQPYKFVLRLIKVTKIMEGLQSGEHESLRLQALMELSHIFLGGTVRNRQKINLLPVGPAILALSDCMGTQNNDQVRYQGARGLRFLFEAIPSSVSTGEAAQVVPELISAVEKVTSIDVAEEGIASLKLLVEKHAEIVREQVRKRVNMVKIVNLSGI